MQTLAPDSFCPLTDLQPYQRERDKPRQGVVANTLNLFPMWGRWLQILEITGAVPEWGEPAELVYVSQL